MLIRLLACSALLLATVSAPAAAEAPPSDPARAELRSIVENVSGATGKRYSVHDDAGDVMDTVKIIQGRGRWLRRGLAPSGGRRPLPGQPLHLDRPTDLALGPRTGGK